jgi:hypothetical protein
MRESFMFGLLSLCVVTSCGVDQAGGDDVAVTPATSQITYGVDYSYARPAPGTLAAQGYTFAARYLSNDAQKNLTIGEASGLIGAGLSVVSNWEAGAQDALGGFAQGASDAQAADQQALAAGMPATRPIYFSIDFDAQPSQQAAIDAYYDGVASVLGRDRTGAYAGLGPISRLFDDAKIAWAWQTYAWSGGQWDPRAQLRQIQNGIANDSEDLDEAVVADFGQWGHAIASAPLTGYVGIAPSSDGNGYWIAKTDGGVFSYGDAAFHGSAGGSPINQPAIAISATGDGGGYYLAATDGGVFSYGDAAFHGSMGGTTINAPVVGVARDTSSGGYWLAAADGGVFTFGDAQFSGSMGGQMLNAPVVGIAAAPGGGYWLVAADGGVFSFGGAAFYGSTGGTQLNAPVVGIAATPTGHGYWLVAADGGVFAFGDAQFFGSMGGQALVAPVTGIAARPQGDGYWLVARDGGVFSFGAAQFFGRPD